MLAFVLLVILAALVLEFINGFHDTANANAIATVVATRVLSPGKAVIPIPAAGGIADGLLRLLEALGLT